ncbi:DNA-binding transcriptional regulator YdaS (Cro superfamily), partial [Oxalobacteraceae bacterium GrIS 1.11]
MHLRCFLDSKPRGYQARMAQRLGISPSYLCQIASGTATVSAARAIEIEVDTDGAVTRADILPKKWRQ